MAIPTAASSIDMSGARVLLVDDQPENLDVLIDVLRPEGFQMQIALNGAVALDLTRQFSPHLILLDVMMPGMDGFETCRQLKADPAVCDIPVIFLTARTDPADVVAGFKAGGVDYITKPFYAEELRMRVAAHLGLRLTVRELQHTNEALRAEIARSKALTRERDRLAGRLSLISNGEVRRWGIEGIVGKSKTLSNVLAEIGRLQQASTTTVLITGESGTGKELVARAIHFGSDRAKAPFVPVTCSAVPAGLADSLFFGHVKGAFTGADRDRVGYFELADRGTLFLDEVGDMPLPLQAKLLRVLEEHRVLPVGSTRERPVDVRVVAATNADLEANIRQGRFRQDLYYRLAGFPVQVPPLRERKEDIPLLARHFVELFSTEMGRPFPQISDEALVRLAAHDFPGNVRELKNMIERALIESSGQEIEPWHLHLYQGAGPNGASDTSAVFSLEGLPTNLEEVEIILIKRAMKETRGNIVQAARLLGISRASIYRRMARDID